MFTYCIRFYIEHIKKLVHSYHSIWPWFQRQHFQRILGSKISQSWELFVFQMQRGSYFIQTSSGTHDAQLILVTAPSWKCGKEIEVELVR